MAGRGRRRRRSARDAADELARRQPRRRAGPGSLRRGVLLLGLTLTFRRSIDSTTQRRCLLSLAVTLWMLAPFAAALGFLFIRLPLIQLAALTLLRRYGMTRAARRFPATIG